MTNKFTQMPDPQDPNALSWLAPRGEDAVVAPKDEADKDEDDTDDLDDEDDDEDFDDEDEDEDADDADESEEPA